MKTIAIIPARGGSERLRGKNTMLLDGIPLFAHSILYAKANNKIIEDVFVSTNDPQIKEIALSYGVTVIDRPEILSGNLEPTVSALKHVLENCKPVDNVILLQPTNPLRPQNLLEESFEIFKKGRSDSLFTVSRNYQKLGRIVGNKFTPVNYHIGQRSQDMEPLYYENGLLYITTTKLILKNKIIGKSAYPFLVDHVFANVDIDTHEDFEYAKYLSGKNQQR